MIISLRGTNSSGKTTVVRNLLAKFEPKPIYGMVGPRKPEAYELVRKRGKPIYVLGPYDDTPTSGVDVISTAGLDCVTELCEKYRPKGHVIMEGILVSSNFGSVGEYLVQYKSELIIAILDTSLEQCVEALKKRQILAGSGPAEVKHIGAHYKRIHGSTRKRFEEYGVRVEMVSRENGAEKILSWLN